MPRVSKGVAQATPEQPEDAVAPEVAPAPSPVRILSVHGFIDEFGDRWHWNAGDLVRNPFVIAMLVERGAPIEQV